MSNKKRPARPRERGFSLVELMVTILILGLLYGSLSPAVDGAVRRAKNGALKAVAKTVQSIAEGYKLNSNGEAPTSRAQMCSSPNYIDVSNPYNKTLAGMSSAFGGAANARCPGHEIASLQAPLLIWSYHAQSWGTNPLFNGVVFYVPYNRMDGTYGANTNTFGIYYNGGTTYGGGTNLSGYEYYIITAVGEDNQQPGTYRMLQNLKLQNF